MKLYCLASNLDSFFIILMSVMCFNLCVNVSVTHLRIETNVRNDCLVIVVLGKNQFIRVILC